MQPRPRDRRARRLRAALALACAALALSLPLPAAAVKLRDVPRGGANPADAPDAPDGESKAQSQRERPRSRGPREREPQSVQKRPRGLTIGLRASTLGAGVELEYPINHFIRGRLLYNRLDVDFEQKLSGIEYDVDLDLQSYGLILDLHPFAGSLRLSAGAMMNDNSIAASAMTTGNRTVNIGGRDYAGSLSVDAVFDDFSPYAGIGWGGGKRRGWRYHFDIGALYQRNPELKFSGMARRAANSMEAPCGFTVNARGVVDVVTTNSCPESSALQAALQTDLETEFNELKDDARGFKWYPVISLGIEYRF